MKNFDEFIPKCQAMVAEYANDNMEIANGPILVPGDIYVVWKCKLLHHAKALLATSLPDDMYYEVTYNGLKDEFYFDAYRKVENKKITE